MSNRFYVGIYTTKDEALFRYKVLLDRNYTVSEPVKFSDGAVNYSDQSGAKTGTSVLFGETWLVSGTLEG